MTRQRKERKVVTFPQTGLRLGILGIGGFEILLEAVAEFRKELPELVVWILNHLVHQRII